MDDAIKGQEPDNWRNHQEPRVRNHIAYCQNYVAKFNHGAPGHLDRQVVDTLAKQLDTQFEITNTLQSRNADLHTENADFTVRLEAASRAKDGAYAERNKVLVLVALMAQRLGINVGIGQHVGEDWDADWRNILFIDLPAGQVSWHLHDSEASMFYFVGTYAAKWDGHTTEEKYRRVLEPGL